MGELKHASVEIPYKFPSFNQYTKENRRDKHAGARMKKQVESDIAWYINKLPTFDKPVSIEFLWVEGNKKRDPDNIASNQKFVLDAMVVQGKLEDDGGDYIVKLVHEFEYSKNEWKLVLKIKEVEK